MGDNSQKYCPRFSCQIQMCGFIYLAKVKNIKKMAEKEDGKPFHMEPVGHHVLLIHLSFIYTAGPQIAVDRAPDS